MVRSSVLCYKVSYCLGATEEGLVERFNDIHTLAQQMNYFDGKRATQEFRALARVYFLCIRYEEVYFKAPSLKEGAGDRLDGYIENISFDIEKVFKARRSLEDFLYDIARRANSLIPDMYKELEIGLKYSDFAVLFTLQDLTHQKVLATRFVLRYMRSSFNFCFFASTVLNIDVPAMLSTDAFLLKRLALVTGRLDVRISDFSELARKVSNNSDKAFVKLSDLSRFDCVFIDARSVDPTILSAVLNAAAEDGKVQWITGIAGVYDKLQDNATPENTLVIAHMEADVLDTLRDLMIKTSIAIHMPVSQSTYVRILKNEWPNTYLLSVKEEDVVTEALSD